MVYFSSIGCNPLIAMNPAEFLLDLANGNINDVSLPSELEDKVQIGNSDTETRNGKPSPAVVHEVINSHRLRHTEDNVSIVILDKIMFLSKTVSCRGIRDTSCRGGEEETYGSYTP